MLANKKHHACAIFQRKKQSNAISSIWFILLNYFKKIVYMTRIKGSVSKDSKSIVRQANLVSNAVSVKTKLSVHNELGTWQLVWRNRGRAKLNQAKEWRYVCLPAYAGRYLHFASQGIFIEKKNNYVFVLFRKWCLDQIRFANALQCQRFWKNHLKLISFPIKLWTTLAEEQHYSW